jgi:GH18 family chitinase
VVFWINDSFSVSEKVVASIIRLEMIQKQPLCNDSRYLDFMNILSYDYHSAFEPAVNHHSPLYPLEEDSEYNFDAQLSIVSTQNLINLRQTKSSVAADGAPNEDVLAESAYNLSTGYVSAPFTYI